MASRLPVPAPVDPSLDNRFAPLPRLPISQWSADKEAAANAARAQREGRYSGADRAANVAQAKTDGTFGALRTRYNAANPGAQMDEAGNIVPAPAAVAAPSTTATPSVSAGSRLPGAATLTPAEVAAGASVEFSSRLPAGTASIQRPGYQNPTTITYSGDTATATTLGDYKAPSAAVTNMPNGLPLGYQGPLASASAQQVAEVFKINPSLVPQGYVAPGAQVPAQAPVMPAVKTPAPTAAPFMTQPFTPPIQSAPPASTGLSRLPGQAAAAPVAGGLSRLPEGSSDFLEQRLKDYGIEPSSAAAAGVRLEEAKTQTALAKARADFLKAQEKAAQQAQKERERALAEAQKVGQEAASRTPAAVSSRLTAILSGGR